MSEQLLRLPDVLKRVGLSKSSVYARVKAGTFPRPVSVGPKTAAWRSSEIDAWIAGVIAASRSDAA